MAVWDVQLCPALKTIIRISMHIPQMWKGHKMGGRYLRFYLLPFILYVTAAFITV